ncbi:MAG: hypothetical protein IKD39_09655, partial [Oscillospiraceae bacterium]|nr:hypothetical protein [Oscillospiraceae bacterium]
MSTDFFLFASSLGIYSGKKAEYSIGKRFETKENKDEHPGKSPITPSLFLKALPSALLSIMSTGLNAEASEVLFKSCAGAEQSSVMSTAPALSAIFAPALAEKGKTPEQITASGAKSPERLFELSERALEKSAFSKKKTGA